jgi:type IV pilus assembly protein PilE
MNTVRESRSNGFTLIELLIAVAIVAILVLVAIPAYTGYVERATRADAHSALLSTAQRLERCFTRNNSYTNCPGLAFPFFSEEEFYQIQIAGGTGPLQGSLTATEFRLRAVAQGRQTRDADCPVLTFDHRGNRLPANCWN